MKLHFTAFLFLVLLVQNAFSQTSSIDYTVLDGCNNQFIADPRVNLYQVVQNDTILIEEKYTAIGTFENLEPHLTYFIRVSSPDTSLTDMTVKDIFALSNIILGIDSFSTAAIIAGDVSGSNYISTLDLVYLQRDLIEVKPLNLNGWFFLSDEDTQTSPVNEKWFSLLPTGKTEVIFKGYQYGAVASTTSKYCNTCDNDSLAFGQVLIPDVNVVAGKPIEFSVEVSSNRNLNAALFSLNYRDLSINNISGTQSSNINHFVTPSTINVINSNFFEPNINIKKIVTIQAVPHRDGNLTSFISINENFDNQFLYTHTDGCIDMIRKISIDTFLDCTLVWPPDTTVNDCENIVNTGYPTSSCSYITFNYSDTKIGCSKLIRKWTALNWLTGELTEYFQIIVIDETLKLICHDVTVLVQDSAIIHAIDLVQSSDSTHIYSFTQTPPYQTKKTLYPVAPKTELLIVYDINDSTYCNVMVTKVSSNCDEEIHVYQTISVENEGIHYNISAKMFDAGNLNHCLGQVVDFEFLHPVTSQWVATTSFPFDTYKNRSVSFPLRYFQENVWKTYGPVTVEFIDGSVLPAFELSCYNDRLTKNTPSEISIFSPTFENIYAIQGALRLQDAILVDTRKVALSDIQFNEELRSLRFIWVFNSQQVTLNEDDTLFTMTIVPTKDGRVSEFLSLADDLLESEAIINDFGQTKINLVFNFVQRPVGTNDNVQAAKVNVYPNPTSNGKCNIEMEENLSLDVYSLDGTKLDNVIIQRINNTLATIELPENTTNTMYLLHAHGNKSSMWKKIFVTKL